MRHCGIYQITCVISQKVYVGNSVSIPHRQWMHRSLLRRGVHPNRMLQTDWNKFGEKMFMFDTIEECEKSSLNEREIFWMSKYGESVLYNNSLPRRGVLANVLARPSKEESRAKFDLRYHSEGSKK